MNEIFMNSSFIKETSSKKEIIMKISHIIFYIDKEKKSDINYVYISLNCKFIQKYIYHDIQTRFTHK
jgi:hypothetical protein